MDQPLQRGINPNEVSLSLHLEVTKDHSFSVSVFKHLKMVRCFHTEAEASIFGCLKKELHFNFNS